MQKKFIALVIILALFCSFVLPTSAITMGPILAEESVTLKEEKNISNATPEDDFADNRIIVVLSNAASTSLHSYTTADFSEFEIILWLSGLPPLPRNKMCLFPRASMM